MKQIDLVWLACAIDGEGSIGIGHQKTKAGSSLFVPYLAISNYSKKFLLKAKRICYGEGSLTQNRTTYQFVLKKKEILEKILAEVKPFLIIKDEQAKLVLEYLKLRKENPRTPTSEIDYRFYKACRKLNRKRGEKLIFKPFKPPKKLRGIVIKKEELEKLYLKEKKTITEIAKIFGVDRVSIWRRLKRNGIPTRKRGPTSNSFIKDKTRDEGQKESSKNKNCSYFCS